MFAAMGRRDLDIVLMCASNLTKQYYEPRMVYEPGMAVHAQAYITNDSMSVQYTMPDWAGDVNPRWDHHLRFSLNCSFGGRKSPEHLNIDLYNQTPDGPSLVGSMQIPLVRFLSIADEGATGYIDYSWPVSIGGRLYFSYRLGPYVSRVPKFLGSIGSVVLGSALVSFLGFELDDVFGN